MLNHLNVSQPGEGPFRKGDGPIHCFRFVTCMPVLFDLTRGLSCACSSWAPCHESVGPQIDLGIHSRGGRGATERNLRPCSSTPKHRNEILHRHSGLHAGLLLLVHVRNSRATKTSQQQKSSFAAAPGAAWIFSPFFLVLAKDGDPYVGYTQEIYGASTSHVLSSCPPASSSRILRFMGFKAGGQTTRVLDAEDKTNLLVLQAPKHKPGIFTCFKAQPLISSDSALGKVWPRY